jgi:hypothetical protein
MGLFNCTEDLRRTRALGLGGKVMISQVSASATSPKRRPRPRRSGGRGRCCVVTHGSGGLTLPDRAGEFAKERQLCTVLTILKLPSSRRTLPALQVLSRPPAGP